MTLSRGTDRTNEEEEAASEVPEAEEDREEEVPSEEESQITITAPELEEADSKAVE